MAEMFLSKEELVQLTGWRSKRKQIEQLRKMKVPFFVNGMNAPVVAKAVIEGRETQAEPPKPKWVPRVLEKG